ncbi:MAG TPA: GNAT family N-acetyltransferase [Alphaproteobacteria bacterium]|nr:GNAT family N-acetyltransferase [Alphaproteobacteria bacterium]
MLPTFETERLLLRPRTLADLEACLAMDRDGEVVRYIPGPWQDPEKHRAFIIARMQAAYPEGMGYWTVARRSQPDAFLGWVLLIPDDGVGPEIEIGWRFVRAAWGLGYATEAARPLVTHAFETIGLARVIAWIHPANRASLRVAGKLGLAPVDAKPRVPTPLRCYALRRGTE